MPVFFLFKRELSKHASLYHFQTSIIIDASIANDQKINDHLKTLPRFF